MWQNFIFPHFPVKAMSTPLNHAKPLYPTFSVPAAQVSLNTSWLYPPPSIRLYCRLGMHGMSPSSPSTHTTDNQQCQGMACWDSYWWFFHSKVNSSGRSSTDTCRHGQIELNQTFVMAPFWSFVCQPALHSEQVSPGNWFLVWEFTSAHFTLLTRWPLLRVGWHWGIGLPVWNIHAVPFLIKKIHSSTVASTLSAEEKWKLAHHEAEKDPVGGCWECVSGSENQVSKRERIWVQKTMFFFFLFFLHVSTHIHALLGGNDGWCVRNFPTLCRPLRPLHHLWWE